MASAAPASSSSQPAAAPVTADEFELLVCRLNKAGVSWKDMALALGYKESSARREALDAVRDGRAKKCTREAGFEMLLQRFGGKREPSTPDSGPAPPPPPPQPGQPISEGEFQMLVYRLEQGGVTWKGMATALGYSESSARRENVEAVRDGKSKTCTRDAGYFLLLKRYGAAGEES